jgi:hypothetical protein
MTTQNPGAPAQQPRLKRTRIDTTANTVIEIDKSAAVAPKNTPSEAALAEVKAAVALRPDATQEVVLDVLKNHLKLKTKLLELLNSKQRMDDDAFIPRSARVDFKLTSSPDIMETEEFKLLDSTMKAASVAYSKQCKETIMEVQAMVLQGTRADLKKHFFLGLKRIAIMLMSEHATYTDDKPCPYAKFIFWMTKETDRITQDVFVANETSRLQCATVFGMAIEGNEGGATPTVDPADHLFYLTFRDDAVKIVKAGFLTAWTTIETKKAEASTSLRLKKTAVDMLEKEKTEAVTMEIDAEPSADPKVLRDLINEGVKNATAKLQKELSKLQQTVQRSTNPKNSNRGASSSQQSASSKKKKGTGQKEGEKKENNNDKGKGKKKQPASPRPPTPRQKRGNSPGRSEPASPSGAKKKKQQTGGPRQQPKKGQKKSTKPRSP